MAYTLDELYSQIDAHEFIIKTNQKSIDFLEEATMNTRAQLGMLYKERERMEAEPEVKVQIDLTEAEIRKLRLALGTLNQAWPSVDNFDLMAMLEKAHHLFCKE